MHLSNKLPNAWKDIIPSISATPLSPKIAKSFIAHLLQREKVGSAAALLLSFYAFLRIYEGLERE